MFGFRHFISEEIGNDLKVVSISEEVNDTYEQINELLDICLSESSVNPYTGWIQATKTLTTFGINLPKVVFSDLEEGVEVIALTFNESEYYFYYEYALNESNQYETFATITDENGLDELLKE
jgi:hypothetical protein